MEDMSPSSSTTDVTDLCGLPGWLLMLVGVPAVCTFAFAFTMFFGWLLVPTYWLAVGADALLRKDLRVSEAPP